MRGGGFGGAFGGMMGGMKGVVTGGINSPNMDNLTDEGIVGSAYDHKVVMRLLTYVRPYRREAYISLVSMVVYAMASISVPLFFIYGIDWAINSGEVGRLHLLGGAFLAVTIIHFVANYLQFTYMPMVGQGILYSLRIHMFNHLQSLSPSFFHRTPVGRIMSRSSSDVVQLQETFELLVQSLADLVSLVGIVLLMVVILPATGGDRLAPLPDVPERGPRAVLPVGLLAEVRQAFVYAYQTGHLHGQRRVQPEHNRREGGGEPQ